MKFSRALFRLPSHLKGSSFMRWPMWDQYICSLYFAVTTMSTVGYGDIVASSTQERMFMIVAMVNRDPLRKKHDNHHIFFPRNRFLGVESMDL
jgi:hypothetical protein